MAAQKDKWHQLIEEGDVWSEDINIVVNLIETIHLGLTEFWSNAGGWAPVEAAELLDKSRLDWMVSLASALRLWTSKETLTDGELILAWVTLGSVLEGSMKLFLSVYKADYGKDAFAPMHTKGLLVGVAKEPDGLRLDVLRQFFVKRNLATADELALVQLIQDRRNAIHAYKDRPIGSSAGLRHACRRFLLLLCNLATAMPYPDSHSFHWIDLASRLNASAKSPSKTVL